MNLGCSPKSRREWSLPQCLLMICLIPMNNTYWVNHIYSYIVNLNYGGFDMPPVKRISRQRRSPWAEHSDSVVSVFQPSCFNSTI